MVSFKAILSLGLAVTTTLAAPPWAPSKPGCGDLDIIFTYVFAPYLALPKSGCNIDPSHSGLPPYHPLVTAQGFNPAAVDAALRGDAANIVKAGYNVRGMSCANLPHAYFLGLACDRSSNLPTIRRRRKDIIIADSHGGGSCPHGSRTAIVCTFVANGRHTLGRHWNWIRCSWIAFGEPHAPICWYVRLIAQFHITASFAYLGDGDSVFTKFCANVLGYRYDRLVPPESSSGAHRL